MGAGVGLLLLLPVGALWIVLYCRRRSSKTRPIEVLPVDSSAEAAARAKVKRTEDDNNGIQMAATIGKDEMIGVVEVIEELEDVEDVEELK